MDSPTVPTVIGNRYELGDVLSQGGMGTVYLGRDTQTQEVVAIKELKPELIKSDPELVRRFIREGDALRALNHPNIVKLLTAAQHNGRYYLVMEYVAGGSLADLIRAKHRLSITYVLALALELADALSRAHYLKIIHRDIKPANVLLAEDGTPRLSDFGVARIGEATITRTGAVMGTVAYLSPEAFGSEPLDARADLWAFGVMLFEMLSGQRPFEGETNSAIMGAILNQRTPDLEVLRPDAPIALVDLIYRMLEKNREERIPSARLVGVELENIMQTAWQDDSAPFIRDATLRIPIGSEEARLQTSDTPHNLPHQQTPFVGRESELAELYRLLRDKTVQLVTILAPGGMGKTRLAQEAAVAQLTHFSKGVFFVPLAPLSSANAIPYAIGEAIRFQFTQEGEPLQLLLDYLRDKQMLLLLDNFDHLMDGVGIISDILQAAPGVKVLATSRERLNLEGETLFRLEGMEFPDWNTPQEALEYTPVKLFVQSAKRVQPDFNLTASNLNYLARICRQVDGLPLGIVLAASWTEVLSLREIADEITRSIDFLETQRRDVPERQRSLRAVFDYSWNTFSADEQTIFKKLSVFRGGFTREAAEKVAGASLRVLMALVNKSMLRRNAEGRYDTHELLRQYAHDKMIESGELEPAQRRHYEFCLELAEEVERHTADPEQLTWLKRLETERDNIRAALAWCSERPDGQEDGMRLIQPLWFIRYTSGHYIEGYGWF